MKRVPLPNGTTVWVSPMVDSGTLLPPLPDSSAWTQITKLLSITQAGGEERFLNYTPLGQYEDERKPNGRNPIDVQFTVQDEPSSAYVSIISSGRDNQQLLAWKYVLPNGAVITYSGLASGGLMPVTDRNQLMVLNFTIAVRGTPQRFAA